MIETIEKGLFRSKAMWGAIAVLAGLILRATGLEISDTEIINVIEWGLEIVGMIMVIIGRYKAKGPIKGLTRKSTRLEL
jgi:hypothetical protein